MRKSTMMLGALLALGVGAVTATVGQGVLSNYVAPAAETAAWTADPADGSRVDALDMVIITFTDFTPAAYGEGSFTATWNGQPCAYTYYNMRGKMVYFDVPRGTAYPTGDGVLKLEATEGYFINSSGQPSPAISYTLYVGNGGQETKEFSWVGNPADGSTVKDATEFSIIFPGFESVKVSDNAGLSITFNDQVDSNFAIKSISGNTVNVVRNKAITGESADMTVAGTLVATFDAGSFILDGDVVSPEFTYTLHQDPDFVEATNTFAATVNAGDPAVGGFVFDRVLGEFAFHMKEEVAVNTACESPINLMLNGTMIGSVQPADDEAVQVFDDTIVNLNFGIEETAEGVYTIEIPEGAFTAAGAPLLASTISYFNGVGTFNPAPGEVSVATSKWQWIRLTPFAGVEINETATTSGEVEGGDVEGGEVEGGGTVAGTVAGTTEKAKLTCGDQVVAEFSIDQLFLYRGYYEFKISRVDFPGIDRDGEYVLSFPKNFFKAGEGENITYSEPFEVKFTVVDGLGDGPDQVYTVSPDSDTFDVFPAITLTYTGCSGITVKEGAKATMAMSNAPTEVVLTFTITAEGNKVTLTPDEDYTKYESNFFRKYTVTVPKGSFDLTYDGASYPNVQVIVDSLRINAPTAPVVTPDPAVDAVVENLNTISFTCPMAIAGTQASASSGNQPKLYSVKNGKRSTQLSTYTLALDANSMGFTLTLDKNIEFTPDAEYEVVLPASMYRCTIDGAAAQSTEQSFRYKMKGLPEFAWEGDPADGSTVTDVNTFTLIFPGFETVVVYDEAEYTATWNGEDVTVGMVIKNVSGNRVTFGRGRSAEGGELTGEGTFVITFKDDCFILDNAVVSTEFTYTLHQDPEVVVEPGESFLSYVSQSDPAVGGFAFDRILGEFAYVMSEEMAVNAECTSTINLLLNGKTIASVQPADEDAVQMFDNVIALNFGVEEQSEGIYTVEIPEGAFTVAGQPVGAAKMKYYVGVGSFNPAPGEINVAEKAWSYMILTLLDGVDLAEGDLAATEPAQLLRGDKVVQEYNCNALTSVGGKVRFNITKGVDINGEYTMKFPASYFMVGEGETASYSEAFELKYTVVGGKEGPAQTYTVSPEAGEYEVFPTITLTYDDGCESIQVAEGAKAEMTVKNTDNTQNSLSFTITAEGNVVTLTPDEDYTKYSGSLYTVYKVTVPAGSYELTYDGTAWESKEVVLTQYKIKAPVAPNVVADPENGSTVANLELITCTVGVTIASNNFVTKQPKVYRVVDGVRETTNVSKMKCTLSADRTGFTMTTSDELEDGEYDIVLVPQLYIALVNGTRCNSLEQVLHYTVKAGYTGVEGVAADDTVTVYTMTGLCVLKNAPADELKNLSKGLYIVNGRKMAIR